MNENRKSLAAIVIAGISAVSSVSAIVVTVLLYQATNGRILTEHNREEQREFLTMMQQLADKNRSFSEACCKYKDSEELGGIQQEIIHEQHALLLRVEQL